jgi:hypothetical protein
MRSAVLAFLMAGIPASGVTIYSTDFQSPVGPEWSSSARDTTPSGRVFLGRFGNSTVQLALAGLAAHSDLTISFDLYVIGSWDGNSGGAIGPDYWSFGVNGVPLLSTTFSLWWAPTQAYPDAAGVGDHPARTGAAEASNSLGYPVNEWFGDSVYHLTYTIPHTSNAVGFDFAGSNLQGLDDESWGLDNVEVGAIDATAVPEPGSLALVALPFAMVLLFRRR